MERDPADYLSYLLRLWRVKDGREPTWRALLKDARTGKSLGFRSMEELIAFLGEQTSGTVALSPGERQASRRDNRV